MTWERQAERGSAGALRLMVWIVDHLGGGVAQFLLYPVTAYFLLSAPQRWTASRVFLSRALGRRAGWRDLYRQYFAFCSTFLDRLYLLRGQTAGYEFRVTGLEHLQALIAEKRGCILLGAHLGSFEAMRSLADQGCPVEVLALMQADHAARATAFFETVAPQHMATVVPLGRPDAMLRAKECLERGGLLGILADRGPEGARLSYHSFLGQPAGFPVGPHALAAVLRAPVMLAFGLWHGARRYEIRFEPFADQIAPDRQNRQADLETVMGRYVTRLEDMARRHPYNWFNFYDFWKRPEVHEDAHDPPHHAPPAADSPVGPGHKRGAGGDAA
ncbi:MAG: hypothetical protein DI532_20770 [Azospirillum brasilense]|uniref:Lipid A biosynthesis lauroyl acyltransferase n=1 Tax=Roseomonas gilardii TaxID=257708 RepID=A0A1L7AM85_9PROT|nr:hypothetical protein [Roseomonas gilardii]APT59849.1 hypothetical protein RGI145_21320 [Roseomonas gilardii]PZR09032.1 MAG: hypothetical protein DI532_20770 [Azospirillum brasilense]